MIRHLGNSLRLLLAVMGLVLCEFTAVQATEPPYDPALLHPFMPPGLVKGEGIGMAGVRFVNSPLDLLNIKTDNDSVGDYFSGRAGVRYGLFDQIELFTEIERADLNISQTFGSLGITTVGGGGRYVFRSDRNNLVGSLDLGYRGHFGDEFSTDRLTRSGSDFTVTVTAPPGQHLISGNTADYDLYVRPELTKSFFNKKLTLIGLLGFHYIRDQSSFVFNNVSGLLSSSDQALFTRVKQNLGRTEQQYEIGGGLNVQPHDRVALNAGFRYYQIQRQWPVSGFAGEIKNSYTVEGNLDIRLTKSWHALFEGTYFQHGLLTEIPGLYNERTNSRFTTPYGYVGVSLRTFFYTGG